MQIRTATPHDCPAMAQLLQQLGYVAHPDDLRQKLSSATGLDCVFVAEVDKRVVACISLHAFQLFHVSGNMGRITALVVDEQYRRLQIGEQLLQIAEQWFASQACVKIELTSGNRRVDAHRFYARHGYVSDGQRFSKKLETEQTTPV